jgi:hypothetical protein
MNAGTAQFIGPNPFVKAADMHIEEGAVERTGDLGELPLCSTRPEFAGHQHDWDRARHFRYGSGASRND